LVTRPTTAANVIMNSELLSNCNYLILSSVEKVLKFSFKQFWY